MQSHHDLQVLLFVYCCRELLILYQNISIKEIILPPSFCSFMLSFTYVIEADTYMYELHKKN